MIELMNVNGINRVDTPYFDTLADQSNYFEGKTVWADDTSYYPPFYHNCIKVSVEDFRISDTDSPVNYCRISYAPLGNGKEKWYYYFIDDIRYITDGVLELDLAMDTIQTYLFDVGITEAFVSRKSIRRWNDDGTINRAYIRENLSQAPMEAVSNGEVTYDPDGLSWIVVSASDSLGNVSVTGIPDGAKISGYGAFRYRNQVTIPTTGGYLYLVPVVDGSLQSVKVRAKGESTDICTVNPSPLSFNEMATNPKVTAIYYLPFNPFAEIEWDSANGCITIAKATATVDGSKSFTGLSFLPNSATPISGSVSAQGLTFDMLQVMFLAPSASFHSVTGTMTYRKMRTEYHDWEEPFRQNGEEETPFAYTYVPALIDENYINEEWTLNGGTVSALLHLLDKAQYRIGLDFTPDGSVSLEYIGSAKGFSVSRNAFGSDVSVSLPQFDLYTDPWKSYQVNHQGSMVTDWIGLGLHAGGQLATSAGFMASRNEYGKRYEERSALQAMRYQERTESYITGFDTLVKSIDEARNSIEDMALGIDQATRGRR